MNYFYQRLEITLYLKNNSRITINDLLKKYPRDLLNLGYLEQ